MKKEGKKKPKTQKVFGFIKTHTAYAAVSSITIVINEVRFLKKCARSQRLLNLDY